MRIKWLNIILVLMVTSCYHPSQEVIQGMCVEYDPVSQVCYLDDESTAEVDRIPFETDSATMGKVPSQGDWLRISYIETAGSTQAQRIMNLTSQKRLLLDVGIKLTEEGPQKIQ